MQRKTKTPPEKEESHARSYRQSTPKCSFMNRLRSRPVVDSLIPTGLSLFCGSQKIGKSWLMLKLYVYVAGTSLWDMPTMEGRHCFYLCLEDTFCRIQVVPIDERSRAVSLCRGQAASCQTIIVQDYLKDYPNSRLIVIDTLQKVRTASKDNAYASDYGDISLIKDLPTGIHWRSLSYTTSESRMTAMFNKVSGDDRFNGECRTLPVLEGRNGHPTPPELYVTAGTRPIQEYTLRFRDCSWELVERKTEQLAKETIPDVFFGWWIL